jgi:ferredoxin
MPKYRIEINREECTGDCVCLEEAPNTFELDEEGIVKVINPDGDSPDEIYAAAEACPTEAIILYDAETGERLWPK